MKSWFNRNTIPVRIKSYCECRLLTPPREHCFDCVLDEFKWSVDEDFKKHNPNTIKPAWWYIRQKTLLNEQDRMFLEGKTFIKPARKRFRYDNQKVYRPRHW